MKILIILVLIFCYTTFGYDLPPINKGEFFLNKYPFEHYLLNTEIILIRMVFKQMPLQR